MLDGKRVVITGGTGSLGQALVRRILRDEIGTPKSVTVFSRDEAKQFAMREKFGKYDKYKDALQYRIGDVADFHAVVGALRDADVVFHTAAMKQVPACEITPLAAIETNITGSSNIVKAICDLGLPVESVVFISTDKACQPLNLYGLTKAVHERLFTQANLECDTRFVGVRYGNVLGSRGSILPLFHTQIRQGGPVTVTSPDMTRFFMSVDEGVDVVLASLQQANPGEIFIPRIPGARILDVANALIGDRRIDVNIVGERPGEKTHEVLISDDECWRAVERGHHYVLESTLPELRVRSGVSLRGAYCSSENPHSYEKVREMLWRNAMMLDDHPVFL